MTVAAQTWPGHRRCLAVPAHYRTRSRRSPRGRLFPLLVVLRFWTTGARYGNAQVGVEQLTHADAIACAAAAVTTGRPPHAKRCA
jgi:hypothetical protein